MIKENKEVRKRKSNIIEDNKGNFTIINILKKNVSTFLR